MRGVRQGRADQPGVSPGASEEVHHRQEVQEAAVQESALDILSEEAEETKLPKDAEDHS